MADSCDRIHINIAKQGKNIAELPPKKLDIKFLPIY